MPSDRLASDPAPGMKFFLVASVTPLVFSTPERTWSLATIARARVMASRCAGGNPALMAAIWSGVLPSKECANWYRYCIRFDPMSIFLPVARSWSC
ncbi:Uncharacterised protein [Mycobacteroides abscessus]|nr:Uncharacterised protein [Mycobacteroides abscessus]